MVEQTGTIPQVTLAQLAAEPERAAREAESAPVWIDCPDGKTLVLVNAVLFDQLQSASATTA